MKLNILYVALISMITMLPIPSAAAPGRDRITILYDAFGRHSDLKKDWRHAALIEYDGKRILFDTGNNAELFKHNVQALGIDLTKPDFMVLSHRHGDHTSGLSYVFEHGSERSRLHALRDLGIRHSRAARHHEGDQL